MDLEGAGVAIRKNVYFRGPTVFILACAIIIASVGLNVNSIPVIIGAMLISPVMGPIIGFGFSLGVQDRQLLKDSVRNFGVMVLISILASAVYFLLSPLKLDNPTELLARTNPTIYDVLIALFGGFAGILESSRKERGTVLSGVAIATALMPPLCTIGYGIAMLKLSYILGAFYLFVINSIFIALATFIGVKYLGYPPVAEETDKRSRLTGRAVVAVMLLIMVPSVFSAIDIVKDSDFRSRASRLVSDNKTIGRGFIYDYDVNTNVNPPTVEIFLAGEQLDEDERVKFYAHADRLGIDASQIILRDEASTSMERMSESEIIKGIYAHSDRQISALSDSITVLRGKLDGYRSKELPTEVIWKELSAQFPNVTRLVLTRGTSIADGNSSDEIIALISADPALDDNAVKIVSRWLRVRLNTESIRVIQE